MSPAPTKRRPKPRDWADEKAQSLVREWQQRIGRGDQSAALGPMIAAALRLAHQLGYTEGQRDAALAREPRAERRQ